MKKLSISVPAVVLLAVVMGACSKNEPAKESEEGGLLVDTAWIDSVEFSFSRCVIEDFAATRAVESITDAGMTDLWVFDYVGGELQQVVHQASTDAGFGTVRVPATIGDHAFCFVASKGTTPTVSGSTISWEKPSDTFWARHELTVTPGMDAQNEDLNRVATRLRIKVTDEISADMKTLAVTPATWYYGLNVENGTATNAQVKERSVTIPDSYVGTSGQLLMSVFGISPASDWQTDVTVACKDAGGNVLHSVQVPNVPIQRNRSTLYSGSLTSAGTQASVRVETAWADEYEGTW